MGVSRQIGINACAAALLVLVCAAMAAEPEPAAALDVCPESCGAVLKLCLETYRRRHECLALTDACTTRCKSGAPILDEHGEVLPDWHYREGDERTKVRW